MAELKSRIAGLDATIKEVSDLVGTLPITELKTKLTLLENNRQLAKNELDQLGVRMASSNNAPRAMEEIRRIISSDFSTLSIQEAARVLNVQLSNNEIRKQLLQLLPTLVHHLIIDLENNSYAIVNHSGEEQWRRVWADNFRQQKVA